MRINKPLLTILSTIIISSCCKNSDGKAYMSNINLINNAMEPKPNSLLNNNDLEAFEEEMLAKSENWPFEH